MTSLPEFVTGTKSVNQATTETATAGTWTYGSNDNGVYSYKFKQSLKGIDDIPYDPNLVHRVGLEIRTSPNISATNIPANNATYTWVPATGFQVESGREIVLYRVQDGQTCVLTTAGLMANGHYDVEGVAETETEAIILPKSAFEELLATSPAFRNFVFTSFGERLQSLITLVQEVTLRHVDRRLARHLLRVGSWFSGYSVGWSRSTTERYQGE